ncbi:MAG: response regulator [Ignavibacteriaceae bacterium]|nr:response regulator [Ignavibacterium sp.]MCC6255197.1 response regulator [Ignavibacteriaceae bacterium]HMN23749.1 response regulator [Ignavibacteriaceae bacterium]HRN27475.1 response regulator [Ignavibacteriaceae bacterium]HRP92007.1 response regulator [Ignavibacteriaceae bacterium]
MQAEADHPALNSEQTIEKPRVLIVEDDPITNEVIQFYLKNDYLVDIAITEQQALGFLKSKKYFAVLLDINLGRGGNGLNVLRELRKIPGLENLPVIAETAFALNGDAEEFLGAGCNYYLSKPFIKPELINVLNKIHADFNK